MLFDSPSSTLPVSVSETDSALGQHGFAGSLQQSLEVGADTGSSAFSVFSSFSSVVPFMQLLSSNPAVGVDLVQHVLGLLSVGLLVLAGSLSASMSDCVFWPGRDLQQPAGSLGLEDETELGPSKHGGSALPGSLPGSLFLAQQDVDLLDLTVVGVDGTSDSSSSLLASAPAALSFVAQHDLGLLHLAPLAFISASAPPSSQVGVAGLPALSTGTDSDLQGARLGLASSPAPVLLPAQHALAITRGAICRRKGWLTHATREVLGWFAERLQAQLLSG